MQDAFTCFPLNSQLDPAELIVILASTCGMVAEMSGVVAVLKNRRSSSQ